MIVFFWAIVVNVAFVVVKYKFPNKNKPHMVVFKCAPLKQLIIDTELVHCLEKVRKSIKFLENRAKKPRFVWNSYLPNLASGKSGPRSRQSLEKFLNFVFKYLYKSWSIEFFLFQEAIAYFPLVILISGAFSSLFVKRISKKLGSKVCRIE